MSVRRMVLAAGAAILVALSVGLGLKLTNDGNESATAPAGDRENPLGPSAPVHADEIPSSSDGAESGGGAGDQPNEPSSETGEPVPSTVGPDPDCHERIALLSEGESGGGFLRPDEICLINVAIEVTGFGPGLSYVWSAFDSPRSPGLDSADPSIIPGNEGACTFVNGRFANWVEFASFALVEQGGKIDAALLPPELFDDELAFTASVRVSQTEYVSIGYDEQQGITTGGLSTSGPADGSRGGEQWPIEGGGVQFAEGGRSTYEVFIPVYLLAASWSGVSVENFSGDEAEGHVSVTCEFAYAPTEDDFVGTEDSPD